MDENKEIITVDTTANEADAEVKPVIVHWKGIDWTLDFNLRAIKLIVNNEGVAKGITFLQGDTPVKQMNELLNATLALPEIMCIASRKNHPLRPMSMETAKEIVARLVEDGDTALFIVTLSALYVKRTQEFAGLKADAEEAETKNRFWE